MKLKYWFTPGGLAYQFRNGFLTGGIAHKYFCNVLTKNLPVNTDDYLIWQIQGKKSLSDYKIK